MGDGGWAAPRYVVKAATECALVIESCHGCSHKLRIPDGKRGTVTCPLCGAQWFHPKTIELSDVEFRCSKSGARFNVMSSRRSPFHKFVIQRIERAGGRDTGGAPSMPPADTPKDQVRTTKVATHNADEYNWSGFSCPYCNASSFVHGGCGHLACDGTVELRNEERFHQCFCGHAGFIIGTIKNFESNWLSAQAELGSTSLPDADRQPSTSKAADVALPPPTALRQEPHR
jgi:hypothetical protein